MSEMTTNSMRALYRGDDSEEYGYLHREKTPEMVGEYFNQPIARKFLSKLEKLPTALKVLDLGAGLGIETDFLKKALPQEIISSDINHIGLLKSGDRPGVQRAQFDAMHIPVSSASMAGIHCKDMLVHVADHALFLRELSRVLAEGGYLYLVSAEISDLPFQSPWSAEEIESLAADYDLKLVAMDEFVLKNDDWYGEDAEDFPRTAFLFRKQKSLVRAIWKKFKDSFNQ